MAFKYPHTLLLVHDEGAILKRCMFRKLNSEILTTDGGAAALGKLAAAAELKDGHLVVTRGTTLNGSAVQSIRNFCERGFLEGTVEVGEPRPETQRPKETP